MENDRLLISDALAGDLDPAAQQAFEARLAHDPAFREAWEKELAMVRALRAHDRARLKEALRADIARQQADQPVAVVRSIPFWVRSAAIVAASLLFVFLIRTYRSEVPDAQQLAMSYYEPFQPSLSRGDAVVPSLMLAYQEGRYEACLPELQRLVEEAPEDLSWKLMLATCLEQTGDYAGAVKVYQLFPPQHPYEDLVEWRLALALLLGGQQEEAVGLFRQMTTSAHYRQVQAKELLKALD